MYISDDESCKERGFKVRLMSSICGCAISCLFWLHVQNIKIIVGHLIILRKIVKRFKLLNPEALLSRGDNSLVKRCRVVSEWKEGGFEKDQKKGKKKKLTSTSPL